MTSLSADRLSPLDTMFLHVETLSSPMHVGMLCRIEGAPLRKSDGSIDRERLLRQTLCRLERAPRFRQRVQWRPLGQGRPLWVDDPHFNVAYHVRFTGLPRPGGATELKLLAGRIYSQLLDRTRPLWEMYWVDGLENDEIGLVWKIHHCMVDGVSGVEVATLMFDAEQDAPPPSEPKPWTPRPQPKLTSMMSDAFSEGAALSRSWLKEARAALVNPEALAQRLRQDVEGLGTWIEKGLAPKTRFNVPIGPHRRVDSVVLSLAEVKRVRTALGGTVNDVALAVVCGALRRYLSEHGEPVDDLELHVGIPVNVRRPTESGALGNRVSAILVLLPILEPDPARRLALISSRTVIEKRSFAANAAETLTNLPGGPPATLLQQVARMQSAQRVLNLVVTNVPGPKEPLYVSGSRLLEIAPYLPLGPNVALGVAVLSYAGQLGIGLIGDYDILRDVASLADLFLESFQELKAAAERAPAPEIGATSTATERTKPKTTRPPRPKAPRARRTAPRIPAPTKTKVERKSPSPSRARRKRR